MSDYRYEYGRAFFNAANDLFVDDVLFDSFEEAAAYTASLGGSDVYDLIVERKVYEWEVTDGTR